MFREISTALLIVLASTSCGDRPGAAPAPQGGTTAPRVNLIAASGWETLKITSGYAITDLDAYAHFEISRNGCWQAGSGAINLDVWNSLAPALNAAATETPRTEEVCSLVAGETRWALDGTVELIRLPAAGGGKRELFRARGREVCTTMKDLALAEKALRAIDKTLYAAFSEDCASAE